MNSPTSSSSLAKYYYKEFLADEGESTDEEIEQEAVMSACMLASRYMKHVSRPPRPILQRQYTESDRMAANARLMKDYFDEAPTYPNPKIFKRRFRMSKRLFLRITGDLENEFDYFKQKPDARGTLGFTAIQKCTSALRVLAYGNTIDINDEYLKLDEKQTHATLEYFCHGIIHLYGPRYLRKPTWYDLQKIYEVHSNEYGLPGMIGSLDCCHWQWYNCPSAWQGQHTRGDNKGPSVILQAVASHDLWVWSAYFGIIGSCNDINIFEQSPLVEDFISDRAAKACFYANGNYYPHGYYLAEGIYPKYSMIVKTLRDPYDEKSAHFKKVQESARKDIGRCFRVLQHRWHYLRNPCLAWTKEKIRDAMYACIIMHNMILEDEGKAICQNYIPDALQEYPQATMSERVNNAHQLRSDETHCALALDLVEHAWSFRYIPNEGEELQEEYDNEGEDDDEYAESEDENY